MPLLSSIEKILEKLLYKRFCTFLNSENIYNLQFVFRQHYSTSHLLINITENIRVALDEGNLKQKKFEGDLKDCVVKDYIPQNVYIKYLGLKTDIDRANTLLFEIRKYICPKIVRSIHFVIFESNLSYCSLVWAQDFRTVQQIVILQK